MKITLHEKKKKKHLRKDLLLEKYLCIETILHGKPINEGKYPLSLDNYHFSPEVLNSSILPLNL